MTSSASGSIADAIQAEPTPVPVPISAKRPRGRAAASSARSRPTSRIDERSKRIAVASASARWTSCGTGIGILRGFSPEERRVPNLSDAAQRTSDGLRVAEWVDDLERDHERACACGAAPSGRACRSRTDRPCSACEPAACCDGGQSWNETAFSTTLSAALNATRSLYARPNG